MKWILVAIIANTPVKTDLVYNSLSECLIAESVMRKHWSIAYDRAVESKVSDENLDFLKKQMVTGTCAPTE